MSSVKKDFSKEESEECWTDSCIKNIMDCEAIENPLRRSKRNQAKQKDLKAAQELDASSNLPSTSRVSSNKPKNQIFKEAKASSKVKAQEKKYSDNMSSEPTLVHGASSSAASSSSSFGSKPKSDKKKAKNPASSTNQASTSNTNHSTRDYFRYARQLSSIFGGVIPPDFDIDGITAPMLNPAPAPILNPAPAPNPDEYDFGGPLPMYYATTEEQWRRDNMLDDSDISLGAKTEYCTKIDEGCDCRECGGRIGFDRYV